MGVVFPLLSSYLSKTLGMHFSVSLVKERYLEETSSKPNIYKNYKNYTRKCQDHSAIVITQSDQMKEGL